MQVLPLLRRLWRESQLEELEVGLDVRNVESCSTCKDDLEINHSADDRNTFPLSPAKSMYFIMITK